MAISVPAATAETPTTSGFLPLRNNPHRHFHPHPKVSFCLSPKPKLRLFSKNLSSRTLAVKAQLNKVTVEGSTNNAAIPEAKSAPPAQEKKNDEPSAESTTTVLASEESLSQFMSQVASLVKLVDSRDIVELELKQLDCEILIRKKEAIPQMQSSAPMVMMQSPPSAVASPPPAAPSPTPAAALPAPAASAPAKPAKSAFPPLKSPMAGTFYRSPAPGEPPFVKVGDKVQKGQVLCIIEAMKLMNEIEADQSGTIVEVIAEDAKPVSFDTPLFVIQP